MTITCPTRRWQYVLTGLMALAGAVLGPLPRASATARVEAVLQPEVTVRGTQIRLGDLGVLRGDEQLAAQAREIVVGQAPLPGHTRDLDPNYIRIRLRQHGMDPEAITIVAPPRVRVHGAAHRVTPEEQIRQAEAAVRRLCGEVDASDLLIEAVRPPAPLVVPEGEVEILADAGSAAANEGLRTVRLEVRVDGVPAATTHVTVRVQRLTPVWVAARALVVGSQLSDADVKIERRAVSSLQRPLPADQPVAGLRTRRALPAGAILTFGALEAVPDVRQGDTLALTVRHGAIRVRATVRALESGTLGDQIRVALPGGREAHARLTAPGAAELTAAWE
ncbi:MAG: flagellar basal body P-ring formation protein FlgA [Armatimonadetes bacterium]|nr:flagellar basal body P-ring formation protein FlgA [Armatimonadota bacterium]